MVAEGRSEQDGSQQYRAAEYEDMLPDVVEPPPVAKPKKVTAPPQSAQQLVDAEKRRSEEQLTALRAKHADELKAQAQSASQERSRRLRKTQDNWFFMGFLLGLLVAIVVAIVTYDTNTDFFGYQITKKSNDDHSSSSVRVPDVNGLDANAATSSLQNRGFKVTRASVPNPRTAAGLAVATYPAGATPPGTTVTLYVSSGPYKSVVTASPVPSTPRPQPPTTLDLPGIGPIVVPAT